MSYECVSARFLFFDGKTRFTIEYAYALSTWYIFKDDECENALWWKKINPSYHRSPNRMGAESILDEFLELKEVS